MKLTPKPCPFCGESFMPRAVQQINCDKAGCQIKARKRRQAMAKARYAIRKPMPRRSAGLGPLLHKSYPAGFRPCLKCDQPIKTGHLCKNCKRSNAEIYVGVW